MIDLLKKLKAKLIGIRPSKAVLDIGKFDPQNTKERWEEATTMDIHEIKVRGSRYFVFNEDDYEGNSGMYDCVLITDNFDEARKLAIEISYKLYFPSSAAIFDAKGKKYYSYVNGELDEEQSKSIKFI